MATVNKDIGSKVYLIHNDYIGRRRQGAKILLAKIKTYQVSSGKLEKVYSEIGNPKCDMSESNYTEFDNIDSAVNALLTQNN